MEDQRFNTRYGSFTQEGKEIIDELSKAVKPILERYSTDIEALVFMRQAIGFVETDISEYILRYGFDLHKAERKEKPPVSENPRSRPSIFRNEWRDNERD